MSEEIWGFAHLPLALPKVLSFENKNLKNAFLFCILLI